MSARPPAWRTGVLLLVMVVLLAVVAVFGYKALVAPIKSPQAPCDSQTLSGPLKSSDVTVRVYNGGSKAGLAASIQKQLETAGFSVPYVGNTQTVVVQTTIVGATTDAPEVQLVAAFFPDATIQADARTDHSVDVLVGDTFAGFNDQAPTQISVDSVVICVTPTPTPSDSPGADDTSGATPGDAPS